MLYSTIYLWIAHIWPGRQKCQHVYALISLSFQRDFIVYQYNNFFCYCHLHLSHYAYDFGFCFSFVKWKYPHRMHADSISFINNTVGCIHYCLLIISNTKSKGKPLSEKSFYLKIRKHFSGCIFSFVCIGVILSFFSYRFHFSLTIFWLSNNNIRWIYCHRFNYF